MANNKFLRLPEVIDLVGLSRSQIYKLIDSGDFPKQIKVCQRVSAWLNHDIDHWIEEQVENSQQ